MGQFHTYYLAVNLSDALYRYPGTILADIQKRPHLPPAPIEVPGHTDVRVLFSYSYSEDQEDKD